METTHSETANTLLLRREDIGHHPVAFELKPGEPDRHGRMARTLAASFLKYCEAVRTLADQDSVDAFIQQHQLFEDLIVVAESFLSDEAPIIQENRPLNELLLNFATYRLTRASRVLYFESLTVRDPEATRQLKAVVKACQKDFDNLLQAL
jgi:hypothetical protein